MIDEIGASIGRSTWAAALALTSVSFSATTWRARKMSVPQSNSTQTTAMPTAVAERTRRTSEAPLIAASIGNVTSVSISSGAIPRPSVRIVTVGAVRSGNTSTGMLRAVQAPAPSEQTRQHDHHPVMLDRPVISRLIALHLSARGPRPAAPRAPTRAAPRTRRA